MNTPDRTESQPPHVPIPDHLNVALLEVVEQGIREAADQPESDRQRIEVSQAVHLRDAYMTNSLTPAQTADLAQRAAQWLQNWPNDPKDTEEVERLLGVTHDLLVVRDYALAVVHGRSHVDHPTLADHRSEHEDDTPRVLTVSPDLVGVLRSQSLLSGRSTSTAAICPDLATAASTGTPSGSAIRTVAVSCAILRCTRTSRPATCGSDTSRGSPVAKRPSRPSEGPRRQPPSAAFMSTALGWLLTKPHDRGT